ncbi:unnamed protein product [Heligmosomoides polygyrus]|uniref:Aminotran_1_2 domain-containing protein n=1 Tax=Heligmosomoides polygyrus TaxID=6339 RepID=A0A3P8B382_HELPZ|nr:unnamed protein product [Heligmosomoides polygyrus]
MKPHYSWEMVTISVSLESAIVYCDHQCHPNSLATGIALKDTVMNQLEHPLVSKNVNMRRIIEPHMSRFFFSQGCRIGQCLMGCTKTKYNMLCEGTAGSLLLEMLTRPLSSREMSSVSFPSTTYLASVLGGLLPHQCAFLTAHDVRPQRGRARSAGSRARLGHHRTAARAALELVAKRRVARCESTLIGSAGTVGIVSAHPSRD